MAKQTNSDIKGKSIGDTNPAETLFMLEAAKADGNFNAKSVRGFKFSGAVDPNSTFTDEDGVKVTTIFTLNTLSANQIANNYVKATDYDDTVVSAK